MSNIVITGKDLTLEQIALICRENVKIELAEEAKQNIIESRKVVDGSSEKPDHHSCGRCW